MRRAIRVLLLLALAAGIGFGVWWWNRPPADSGLELYGNVDLRQVELAFNNSQRIAEVLVQEGDHVKQGQVLARLDTNRLEPQVMQAEAQVAAQRQAVERLHNGSRPEEIAQAQANLGSAKADAANAKRQFDRLRQLAEQSAGGAVSQQDVDNSKAALAVAEARVEVNQKTLELLVVGPRKEDIGEAEAQLRALEAQLAFLKQEFADAQLLAPTNAVVRTRVMEPGEMASPQRPVLMLAIVDPKWVRAYVSEPDLGHVFPGQKAQIGVDSFTDRRFEGWIGFISPVAEFTPKAVQTEELRTSLVYEVRVFVVDPRDELRLGMPATVYLNPDDKQTRPAAPAADAANEPTAEPASQSSRP